MHPVESWPLVLAGPIVRRVEPTRVSVWVALKEPRAVRLSIFLAPVDTGGGFGTFAEPPPLMTGVARTLPVGANLHVVVATAAAEDPLLPGHVYAYNLSFGPHAAEAFTPTEDLKSLRLLVDFFPPEPQEGQEPAPPTPLTPAYPNLALGYGANELPTFAMSPGELRQLRLVHGSCRLAKARINDVLPDLDETIRLSRLGDPLARPHQLFMTGDQIYADEVATALQHLATQVGNAMFGAVEKLPVSWAPPGGSALGDTPCDLARFPAGLRRPIVTQDARLTTIEGESHLLSFAEYTAAYLLHWCNVLWPKKLPDFADVYFNEVFPFPEFEDVAAGNAAPPPVWQLHLGLFEGSRDGLKDEFEQTRGFKHFDREKAQDVIREMKASDEFREKFDKETSKDPGDVKGFVAGLAKVRRVLANVPTYMIFDDHDVTDDWNLSLAWRDRVFTSPLGRTILRNGLLAYLICQGWGNDPDAFLDDATPRKRLLFQLVPQIFPAGAPENHDNSTTLAEIDQLLGLDGNDPPVKWHYRVDGPHHRVMVLDTRTRRGYATHTGPPSGLSLAALADQIPLPTEAPVPAGIEVVVVVSTIPMLGIPLIDEFGGQLAVRALDLAHFPEAATLPGTFPDAGEAWANVPFELERVLARLAAFRRTVILSGDVHFGHSTELSYWLPDDERPARIAQFTSSGFKQIWPAPAIIINRVFTSFDRLLDLASPITRLGWNAGVPEPIDVPDLARLSPGLRLALHSEPVLWPGATLPAGSVVARPPDFAWRAALLVDPRPHDELPAAAKPAALELEPGVTDVAANIEGYRLAARRHAAQLDKTSHTRRILFASNFGMITFTREETDGEVKISARQELFANPGGKGTAAAFTRHDVALDVDPEPMPAIPIAEPDA